MGVVMWMAWGRSKSRGVISSTTMIEQGWAALRAGDASSARDAFERALEEAASGAALEGLGHALYLQRDYPGSIAQHERAYAAYRREGQTFAAGRAARILAWITGSVLGDWAVQNGWLPGRSGSSRKPVRTPPSTAGC